MLFSSIKEINRLTRKGTSNIYLKVTIEKNWLSQILDFLSLKNPYPGQFLGSSNSRNKNCEFKVKLWWVGAGERKKSAFFVTFILSEGNFFNICVLSQCIVYWMNVQNIYTLTCQKTNIIPYTFLLVFVIVESLQCILNFLMNWTSNVA